MLKVRAKYPPGTCDYDGYQEIRWDLSGCNLRCLFCWSPASRPFETNDPVLTVTSEEVAAETLRSVRDRSRAFIRFTGGEPTIQWNDLADVLMHCNVAAMLPKPPILFQTNGIEIGKGTVALDVLTENTAQYYLFELSFKGTNPDEFSLLTGKTPDLYKFQLDGYQRLLELSRAGRNVRVVAVLGVYHSSTRGPSKYAFVNPSNGKLLFDDLEKWDPRFSRLWSSAPLKWVEPLRMSPMGVWKNVLKRCGSGGADVLRYFPAGTQTNARRLFPAKPRSRDYARQIVTKKFWL